MSINDKIAEATERMEAALDEMDRIRSTYGDNKASWPKGQAERFDRMSAAFTAAEVEAEALQARAEKIDAVRDAAAAGRTERYAVRQPAPRRRDPWSDLDGDLFRTETPDGWNARGHDAIGQAAGLSDEGRRMLADAIDRDPLGGRAVTALSNPRYAEAFATYLANPVRGVWTLTPEQLQAVSAVEAVRASMSTDTSTAGWSIPLSLNPAVTITNSGVASQIRNICRRETAVSSPHRALTTAGVTGEWLAEGSAAAAADPVLGRVDVELFKASAFLSATVEWQQDTAASIASMLPALLADARERLEGDAFVTGNGSSAPAGLLTRVQAVTASRVSATTTGQFALVDVYKTWDAMSPRSRQGESVAWLANVATISRIRQADVYGGGSFIANLAAGQPPLMLGAALFEASALTATVTTGSALLIAGNFADFLCVDHVAGSTVEFVPTMLDQATGRPNGTSGWFYHHRVGTEVVNSDSFRVLVC